MQTCIVDEDKKKLLHILIELDPSGVRLRSCRGVSKWLSCPSFLCSGDEIAPATVRQPVAPQRCHNSDTMPHYPHPTCQSSTTPLLCDLAACANPRNSSNKTSDANESLRITCSTKTPTGSSVTTEPEVWHFYPPGHWPPWP